MATGDALSISAGHINIFLLLFIPEAVNTNMLFYIMISNYGILSAILICGMLLSVYTGKLTIKAAIAGGIIGFLVFTGAGFTGIAMMTSFFIMGSSATAWKINMKQSLGLAEKNKGRRNALQVIANAGVAAVLGLLVYICPQKAVMLQLMMAAGFASASADTLSSELGNIYGRRFYNILSLKKDTRGLNGVISIEGTLFGVAGSTVIAIIYATGFGWNKYFTCVILAGTAGNVIDSVLGASLERKHYLQNDAVNFLNTITAAATAFLLYTVV